MREEEKIEALARDWGASDQTVQRLLAKYRGKKDKPTIGFVCPEYHVEDVMKKIFGVDEK